MWGSFFIFTFFFWICQWWFCFFLCATVSLSPMTIGDLVVLGLALSVSRVSWMKLMILTLMRSSGKKRMTGHSHQPWTLWLGKKLPKLSGRTALFELPKTSVFAKFAGGEKFGRPQRSIFIFLSNLSKVSACERPSKGLSPALRNITSNKYSPALFGTPSPRTCPTRLYHISQTHSS